MRPIKILTVMVLMFIFLLQGNFYLYCQEKQDTREESRQHYLQGKKLYSQGRYQEATAEFEKAVELMTLPKLDFIEKIQKEQQKALGPASASVKEELPSSQRTLSEKEKMEEKGTVVTKTALTAEFIPETEEAIIEKEYYIDIGDVLDISVWKIPDLSRSDVIVRPDGKISSPLIGDIKAEGLTLVQLDGIITERLKAYVQTPEVSIMIRSFGEETNKVVILGEIIAPGVYKFGGPPTITEVIASAGGYTKYAVLNSIMVISGDIRTKPKVTRVNFAQIIKSGRLSENIALKPNDIVYVPRSFIGNLNTFLEILQPAVSEYMQTLSARQLHNTIHRKGGL